MWRMGRDPGRWHRKEKIQGTLLKGGGCPKDREVQGTGGSGKEKRPEEKLPRGRDALGRR